MSTTTNLSTLKINYLTQSQYDTALSNNQINENEIYLTPTEDMTTQEIEDFIDSLQAASNGPVIDYIVEEGTSGIWTYRKWSSGIAECWGFYSKSIAASAVDFNNYITFPFAFTTTPVITLGLSSGGADLYRGHVESSSTNNTQVRLVLINKHTAAVVVGMNMHAIGRWK